jgi:hypothetical protein
MYVLEGLTGAALLTQKITDRPFNNNEPLFRLILGLLLFVLGSSIAFPDRGQLILRGHSSRAT